jgi:hypothetical protein
MYLRTISRRNKNGSVVCYLQLAQIFRVKVGYQAKAQVVHSFGREDQLDRQALIRLARSITRLMAPEAAGGAARGELQFAESRPMGGAWALDHLRQQLGMDRSIKSRLNGPKLKPRVERVFIPGLEEVDDDSCYRAMDFLLECEVRIPAEKDHRFRGKETGRSG